MNTFDVRHIPRTGGIVYGLLASDEPLQIRYVGQTVTPPEMRLYAHFSKSSKSRKLKAWFREVADRGAEVQMRTLGTYSIAELGRAERKWIEFWNTFCDLFNFIPSYSLSRTTQFK